MDTKISVGFKRKLESNELLDTIQGMKNVDDFLCLALQYYAVFVVPSVGDPTSLCLPIAPLNPLLLPHSSMHPNLVLCPNPLSSRILGKSAQILDGFVLDDWRKNSPLDFSEDYLINLVLESRLLCPTAPESLCAFPFQDKDPFVLAEMPELFFVANRTQHSVSRVGDTFVCKIASFSATGTFTVFNPMDSSCRPFRVSTMQA